jgi:hypothetical protein
MVSTVKTEELLAGLRAKSVANGATPDEAIAAMEKAIELAEKAGLPLTPPEARYLYDVALASVAACEARIAEHTATIAADGDDEDAILSAIRARKAARADLPALQEAVVKAKARYEKIAKESLGDFRAKLKELNGQRNQREREYFAEADPTKRQTLRMACASLYSQGLDLMQELDRADKALAIGKKTASATGTGTRAAGGILHTDGAGRWYNWVNASAETELMRIWRNLNLPSDSIKPGTKHGGQDDTVKIFVSFADAPRVRDAMESAAQHCTDDEQGKDAARALRKQVDYLRRWIGGEKSQEEQEAATK